MKTLVPDDANPNAQGLADPLTAASARRFEFLAEASEVLAASLDYEQTLQDLAHLCVPVLGDLCIVDVLEEGRIRRVATAHADPAKAVLLQELRRRYPPSADSPQPAARVLRTGEPELLVEVTPSVVASHTRDVTHAELIKSIGIRSHLAVPLVARGTAIGVISLGMTESGRRYGPDDLRVARELARSAALAVDNARLYRGAQEELAERRRAEEALRQSEERYRKLMEQSPLSTQVLAPDGRTLRVNRAWEELWGGTLEEHLADYNLRTDPQLEALGLRPLIERAFAGEPVELPAVPYTPDRGLFRGQARWVRAVMYPVRDANGNVEEVVLVHQDITDQRKAEAALRESENRLRTLADNLPAGFIYQVVQAPDGARRFTYLSGGVEMVCGISPAAVLADSGAIYRLVEPEDRPQLIAAESKAIQARQLFDHQFRIRTPAGQLRWLHCRSAPRELPDGGAVWDGVAADVTDRRRAEDAQRFLAEAGEALATSLDSEETLAAVARLVVPRLADWCAIYALKSDGHLWPLALAHANPDVAELARDLALRCPPDPNAASGIPAVLRTGEPELMSEVTDARFFAAAREPEDLKFLRELGLQSAVIAPLAGRGRTFGAVAFVSAESRRRYGPDDLTLAADLGRRAGLAMENARLFRESQEALRFLGLLVEAAARLTGSLNPADVSAAILDLSHRLLAADAHAIWRLDPSTGDWAIADSSGLSESYLRDQGRISTAGEMPDYPVVAEDVASAAVLEAHHAAYRAEGIASVLSVPLRIHGVVSGTLVFYYRERQRFDEVMVRAAAALADLAAAALGTSELYGREAESRRLAEEADRRKDQFMAMLAHELRNPLAPIRTALEILGLRGQDTELLARMRDIMDRQVTHLSRLVDDLLDVSRITTGNVRLRREPLDLARLARQAASDHRSAFDAKGVRLSVATPDIPVWVNGDPTRLAQVLDNLLTNALKFTAAEGEVSVTVEPDRGGRAALLVRDTGAGLEPEMLGRLFEPFSQADRTLDRSAGGLGLGLAIVKGLATLHGGAVRAESAGLGLGSTFTVTLPAHIEPPALTSQPTSPRQAARGLRVLVVEDNKDAAESLRILLEAYGYLVAVAHSGSEGIRTAQQHQPDVVVCDIGLPGLDGYGVAAALRQNPVTASARLIALTGYGGEEDRRRAAEAGFDEHLTKPADPVALASLLAAVP